MERRLAAIFAADVVGYSRLIEADEEATLRRLNAYREVIDQAVAEHHGRVFGSAGDSVVAEFASPVESVRCAASIQRQIAQRNAELPAEQRMQFRIGINLGDVVVEGDNLLGDGVNVAARLEGLADAGGICISEGTYAQVKKTLNLSYEFLGNHTVKNIKEPVPTYRVRLDSNNVPRISGEKRRRWQRAAIAIGAIVVVALVMVAAWDLYLKPSSPTPNGVPGKSPAIELPDKPSIAVLPFDNMSADPKQNYFADGLTEDLITNLSLYRELFVISRNSTFTYKGKAVNVKRVGRELGVAFVVEGSVQRDENRVRITAQLIDARTGSHVWGERFDRELIDIFAVQDEITRVIAGRLAPEVAKVRVEKAREIPTMNLDAWDLYLQARAAHSVYTRDMQETAVKLGEMAIARDPNFASPYSIIARAKATQYFYQWTDDRSRTLTDAIENARMAIRLDGNDPVAYAALGYAYRLTGDETLSIPNLERAVGLNPNDANVRLEFAHTLDWFRHQDRALPEILEAIRLNPRDPRLQMMFFYKAHILFHLHKFEASLAAAKEMSSVLTTDTWRIFYHLVRAANLAELGRSGEAQAEIKSARALNPKLSLASIRRRFKDSYNHPENRRIWLDSLRKAGMTEE